MRKTYIIAVGLLALLLVPSSHAGSGHRSYEGDWCWTAPDSTARTPGGSPFASLSLHIEQLGAKLTGRHCAISVWGNRIDCILDDAEEPSIHGKAHKSHASLKVRSDYTGKTLTAKLTPSATGLRWEPLDDPEVAVYDRKVFFANWYLPWEAVDLVPCE